jgi:hypothetical protein
VSRRIPIPNCTQVLRATLVTVLGSAVTIALGCGGSGSSSTATTALTGTAVGLSSHAEYAGFAHAVNLRSEDVPGFVVEPHERKHLHTNNKAFEDSSQYRRCFPALVHSKPVFKADSTKFKSGAGLDTASVHSSVEIVRSARAAERELVAGRKEIGDPRTRTCLASVFDALGSQSRPIHIRDGTVRITVGNFALAPIPVSAATQGTGGGAGFSMQVDVVYHVVTPLRSADVPATVRVDSLAFIVGRAEVSMNTLTLGSAFPSGIEARLFATLVSRARSASHFYRKLSS